MASTSASGQEKQALITTLRLLAATPKSRKALEKKLRSKWFLPEIIEKTLNQLEKEGLLNDRTLAQSLVQSLMIQRPSGRRRVVFELERRGIAPSLAQEALERYSVEEERRNAYGLAALKWERWGNSEIVRRRKKVYDFLVRRGFDYTLAREVIEALQHEKA